MRLISRHGGVRMRKRQGLKKKSLERQAQLAKERGLKQKDMTGRLHKWVLSVRGQQRKNGARYIIYNNSLFVFHWDYSRVITVITVPSNLNQLVAVQLKKVKPAILSSGEPC